MYEKVMSAHTAVYLLVAWLCQHFQFSMFSMIVWVAFPDSHNTCRNYGPNRNILGVSLLDHELGKSSEPFKNPTAVLQK